jgi:hypothetical protein
MMFCVLQPATDAETHNIQNKNRKGFSHIAETKIGFPETGIGRGKPGINLDYLLKGITGADIILVVKTFAGLVIMCLFAPFFRILACKAKAQSNQDDKQQSCL